ncbi:GHKL domain-containing protein [Lactonifactor longoviformis DSM 17459]|uniref:GHKL domain-containing protein n=1 Tax=Lactonifactor longoviformis DSM 17459 TaxID=1122155 RepID=A0A1M4VYT7_9CLOT|nr:GHKL domain-containing protein [Lactonifactor longoviformis DSM 17459]
MALINVLISLYLFAYIENYRENRRWGRRVTAGYIALFQIFCNQGTVTHISLTAALIIADTVVMFLLLTAFTWDGFRNFLLYKFYDGISNVVYRILCMLFFRVTGRNVLIYTDSGDVSPLWGVGVVFLLLSFATVVICCKNRVFYKVKIKVIEVLFLLQVFMIAMVIALDMRSMQRNLIMDVIFFGMCTQILYTYLGFLWSRRAGKKRENEILQASLREQSRYYQEYYQSQESIKRMRHDLANHAAVIDRMEKAGEHDKASAYREQLEQALDRAVDSVKQVSLAPKKERPAVSRWERLVRDVSLIACLLSFGILAALIVSGRYLIWIYIFTLVMLFLASVYVMLFYHEKQIERENAWLRQQLMHWEEGQQEFEELAEQVRSVRRWLQQRAEGEGYEKELLEQCDAAIDEGITGSFPVDAMLHSKLHLCRKFHILTDIQVLLPEESQMEDIHTVGLLGNLLDNAIEACRKGPAGSGYIYLRTAVQANFWEIRIDNYTENEGYSSIENHFATTKEDKENHGFGMKIVRSMVEKYDGVLQVEEKDHLFSVTVMVKIY